MVEQLSLMAASRIVVGRAVKRLRRDNLVPAILYGSHTSPQPIQVNAQALKKVLMQAGETRLISLNVEGDQEVHTVLVREVQRDALTRAILHVDFYEVVMTERLRATVPLHFIGESPLVQQGLAVLNEALDEVEVECLPADLPSAIEVDVSKLVDFDMVIRVGDLEIPAGVEILTDADETVASLSLVKVEEEVAAEEQAEVEVVAKGKAARVEEIEEEG
jgi:large subunit ribosomal protein L25